MADGSLKSDIFIMNSKAEGFGRVTVEAMLAGCLVLGRRTGGTLEIIDNAKNGILYDTEEEAARYLEHAIQDRILSQNLASEGREVAF